VARRVKQVLHAVNTFEENPHNLGLIIVGLEAFRYTSEE
jgi:hypothetical protein